VTMYDEWIDPKLPLLVKPFTELSPDETKNVDQWISLQFRKKSWLLLSDAEGIQVVDRCQLDPLAFVAEKERSNRASALLSSIVPNKSRRRIRAGHVIILKGDERVMATRTRDRHKGATPEYVAQQQRIFDEVYPIEGVTRLDVRELTPEEIVRRIARLVHLEPYCECDLHERLSNHR
jgi:hypothetical protein